MRSLSIAHALLAAACAATGVASAEPVYYVLDPDFSFVHFEVQHFGTSTIRGRIGPVSGEVMLDREASRGRTGLSVKTATVDLGFPIFNARLRQPDLFDSEGFPDAYFVAERFRFEDGKPVEVRGEFTVRGTGQPLSLNAIRFSCRGRPIAGEEVCGGDFEGHFLRSDFGMSFGLPFVGDRIRLIVQVEGLRR